MADILGENFNYTYNGTLLTEVFFKPSTATPALNDMFRVIPGSDQKIQIPTVGNLSKVLAAGGNCATETTHDGIDLANQTVDLSKIRMRVEECAESFEGSVGSILSEQWLRDGVDVNDISGTELQATINQLLEDALRRDVFRLVSFGDASDSDDFYGIMEGLIPQLIANSGSGSSYCVNRTTDFGTGALSNNAARDAFKAAYEGADARLAQIPENQKAFFVTRSVFDNYLDSLDSTGNGSDLQVTYTVDGVPNVRYRGIPVVKISEWDNALADTNNPLNGTVEHVMIYTTRENHVLGVQNNADLNRIKGWYSDDDDIYRFDSKMRLGYNYVHCDLTVIGY